jgi:hypothetical protein
MPTPLRRTVVLAVMTLALGACSQDKRDGEPRMAADEPEAAEHATGVSAEEANRAQATPASAADLPAANPRAPTAFACDGGNRVEIGDLVAVVTLKDGRTVQIARDPDDAFHFRGEALAFRMKDGEGELSQDEGGVFRCHGS